ncbi:Tat pathway signal protein [Streptomyces globosus]|uniref:Tat pathway signal protein n=1 Tax=Streptomyces globosus TaxID=68209 RepID=A0A344TYL3_9ACTN|nr:Tat pathway signal protein [Streptomyces globosus]AXE23734.1 Tat pathway signal protein [Streptomyces globosus]
MPRERNTLLEAVLRQLGWSQATTARQLHLLAAESGADGLQAVSASHINQWVRGSHPSPPATRILCETLSRGLNSRGIHRIITAADIGLTDADEQASPVPRDSDPIARIVDLGGTDLDLERRHTLKGAAFSLAGMFLPSDRWWQDTASAAQQRTPSTKRHVGPDDVAAVREMTQLLSRREQRRGGADGRSALVAYLRTDVTAYLSGRFPDDHTRQAMFTAAGELAYLAGWTSFDASEHALAQQWLAVALRLSAEADDAPLAGHILRAQAHQTLDLGHPAQALRLAEASVRHRRYTDASPRERSLLGVVHARSLAAAGHKQQALATLLQAENDLRNAEVGDDEPARVFFFSEASLAHETARTLQALGDLRGAEHEFQRSVRTRKAQPFARTHAVTLGLLGAVQIQRGAVDMACTTWSQALDAMQGVQSGRALDTVVRMRRALSPYRGRGGTTLAALDGRARNMISRVR